VPPRDLRYHRARGQRLLDEPRLVVGREPPTSAGLRDDRDTMNGGLRLKHMVKLRHKPISNQRSIIPRSTPSMEGGAKTALTTCLQLKQLKFGHLLAQSSAQFSLKLVEQNVLITWTRCALGGRRPWFVCNSEDNSGTRCGRRAAKIYLGAYPVFACRCCQGLTYASQKQTPHLRLISKAMKIRMRLGGSPNLSGPFPDRPKGLHRKTYERLRKIHDAADSQA
jgi:hypothetical protein